MTEHNYPDSFQPRYGDEFDLPPLVYTREKGLINKVKEILNESPDLRDIFVSLISEGEIDFSTSTLLSLIGEVFDVIPDALPEFVAIITDKEVEWLEENLSSGEMVRIIKNVMEAERDEFSSMFDALADQLSVETPSVSEVEVEEE